MNQNQLTKNPKSDTCNWYAYLDQRLKCWRPLFCTIDFVKWGDVKISDEAGEKFYRLRKVQCEVPTALAIEAAIFEQYARIENDQTHN